MSAVERIISTRGILESDLELIMKWRMDPEITRYMNTDPVLTIDGQKEWKKQIDEDMSVRYWLIKVDGIPAGVINLADIDWTNRSSSWGYYIGEKRMRSFQVALSIEMSLYDYVFYVLDFIEIHNESLTDNSSVIKIHEFCGNKVTRIVENEVEKGGKYYDVAHMSITKEQWTNIRTERKYQKIHFCKE